MTRPRLLLHAGLHKTGTTALQEFAATHRQALRNRGLWYPTYEPLRAESCMSHNRLAHSIARTGKSGTLSDAEMETLVGHWRKNAAEDTIFLSAEALCRHLDDSGGEEWLNQRITYLRQVAELLSDFDVEVVLVLRRQDEFVHSAYLENIMKNTRQASMRFEAFREYMEKRHLQYEDNLEAFATCFDRVRVLIYDDLRRNKRLCGHFFSELGTDVEDLPEPGIVRESLSPRQARLKRAMAPLIISRGMNRMVNVCLNSRPVEWWFALEDEGAVCGFWASEQERREWQRKYENENDRIRCRFLPERSALFPEHE